jgi:molybdopterin converting factor subunit 1
MRVTVLLFARLKDIVGRDRVDREVADGATAGDVWRALATEFPELGRYTTAVSAAVNEEYARMSAPVHDRDEVAFLPPVSGGQSRVR